MMLSKPIMKKIKMSHIDEELSSRAKLVKELYNKAKEEKKSKKDVFEADPEMEIMPSPQYSQPKK
jgi:hypothetical protein